jgi:hypothetical protein
VLYYYKMNCNQALIEITDALVSDQEANINYRINKYNAWVDWQNAQINNDIAAKNEIASTNASIDNLYSDGYYVLKSYYPGIPQAALDSAGVTSDYWNRKVGSHGMLYNCPNGWGGCCDSLGSNEVDNKCCALGKYRSCTPCAGSCGGWYGWDGTSNALTNPYAAHNRLSTNIFQGYIDTTKQKAANDINSKYAMMTAQKKQVYDSILAPIPGRDINIGCCQSYSISGISGNVVSFDKLTQQCTIINPQQAQALRLKSSKGPKGPNSPSSPCNIM